MGQALPTIEAEGDGSEGAKSGSRLGQVLPSLVVAVGCTILIIEAIIAVVHGRENGDLMLVVCPILGATFLSIPTVRAWWAVLCWLRGS
jgi:hypothetical protein